MTNKGLYKQEFPAPGNETKTYAGFELRKVWLAVRISHKEICRKDVHGYFSSLILS